MTLVMVGIIITDDYGREHRYDRWAQSTSLHDRMRAEDSAIRAYIAATGQEPYQVRPV
jgi:hypothetical protein